MQKVIRRTQLAMAQAARKRAKQLQRQQDVEKMNVNFQNQYVEHMRRQEKKRVISEIKEDFRLGPLAPIRGHDELEREQRQGVRHELAGAPLILEKDRIEHWNIVPGDNVVVVNGKEKGKYGKVKSIDRTDNTVRVKGVNMIRLRIAEYFDPSVENNTATALAESWLHYDDVRLCHPHKNPHKTPLHDLAIDEPEVRKLNIKGNPSPNFNYAPITNLPLWKRYVPSTNIMIKWPKGLAEIPQDQPPDTRLKELYEVTREKAANGDKDKPPMPRGIIDELRNKYSLLRTRHDPEWVAERKAEDELERARKNTKIVTPLMEFNRKVAREKKAMRKGQRLTRDILKQIGFAMAGSKPVFGPTGQLAAKTATDGAVNASLSSTTTDKEGGEAKASKPVEPPLQAEIPPIKLEAPLANVDTGAQPSADPVMPTTDTEAKAESATYPLKPTEATEAAAPQGKDEAAADKPADKSAPESQKPASVP